MLIKEEVAKKVTQVGKEYENHNWAEIAGNFEISLFLHISLWNVSPMVFTQLETIFYASNSL